MTLTLANLLEWTKLTVRQPATASALVKSANLPIEVSALMIVLAGVMSGLTFGIFSIAIAPLLAEIEQMTGQTADMGPGPLLQGFLSAVQGLAFAFAVHRIGGAFGGKGRLTDIFAVTAVVQIVLAVIFMAVVLTFFIFEILGALLAMISVFVFFRGLGHAVNVGHDFNSMSKSIGVIIVSFGIVIIVISVLTSMLGLSPTAAPTGEIL